MMIKWVVCSVPVSERTAFVKRQRAWKRFSQSTGFMGRIGGWNIKNPQEANVITFWRDEDAYQAFLTEQEREGDLMDERDMLFTSQVYQKQNDIFGLTDQPVFSGIPEGGHLLKIGDCQVRPVNKEHFLLMQQSVWNLGMSSTPGMTTGSFAESYEEENQFLILTRWKSEAEYKAYEEHILPKLLHWAYDGQVEEQFQGRLVRLMKDWCMKGEDRKASQRDIFSG